MPKGVADGGRRNPPGGRFLRPAVGPSRLQVEQPCPSPPAGVFRTCFCRFFLRCRRPGHHPEDPNPNIRCHLAHSARTQHGKSAERDAGKPALHGLRKPRTRLIPAETESSYRNGGCRHLRPNHNTILLSGDKVAAWFLDTDYDGRTSALPRPFSPTSPPGGKSAAPQGSLDEGRFAAFTERFLWPFPKSCTLEWQSR